MKALLIDPYQKKIHEVEVSNDLQSWYDLLRCELVDRVEVHRNPQGDRAIDVWIDDEGLLREPTPPMFKVHGYPQPLAGYGLVLSANLATGESISCTLGASHLSGWISWEPWERRLNPQGYFEELTRVPSWEKV
jgi:hypothetical protein